jgi:hypothetical protein
MTLVSLLLFLLLSVALLAEGVFSLIRPRTVMRWWRRSMVQIPAWPPPSTPDRALVTYIIVWGLITTCAGIVLTLTVLSDILRALAHPSP